MSIKGVATIMEEGEVINVGDVIIMLDGGGSDEKYIRIQNITTGIEFEGTLSNLIMNVQRGFHKNLIIKCVKKCEDRNGIFLITLC